MNDLVETLWNEFAVETEEHFDLIEPCLINAESDGASDEDIAQLFRSFHSIKGLSRSMDMRGMETVAHRAENLLGLVRDGTAPLDADVVSMLLEGVDALKELKELAVSERQDAPAPEDLVKRLEAAFDKHNGGGGNGAAPAAQAAQAVAETAVAKEAEASVPEDAAVEEEPEGSLVEDPEMLTFFAELLQTNLPILANMATPEIADETLKAEVGDALQTLMHAASVMEFEHLSEIFGQLQTMLDDDPTNEEHQKEALKLLGEVREKVGIIETEAKVDAGGSSLGDRLEGVLNDEFSHLYNDAAEILNKFEKSEGAMGIDTDQSLAEQFCSIARGMYTHFLFLEMDRVGSALLMVEDVYSRVSNGEMFLYPEILRLTREAIDRAFDCCNQNEDLDADAALGIVDRFRAALLSGAEGFDGTDPMSAVRRVLADFEIRPELVEILSAENIRDLVNAVREGGKVNLFEILAHLETSEELAMGFVKWVQEKTQPITNRTVFMEGKTWFEFLVVTDLEKEAVETEVAALDPSGELVKVRSCKDNLSGSGDGDDDLGMEEDAGPQEASAGAAPTPARRPQAAKKKAAGASAGSSVLRVRGETIDQLMAQIGEMVTVSSMLNLIASDKTTDMSFSALRKVMQELPKDKAAEIQPHLNQLESVIRRFQQGDQQLYSALGRLQDSALELRVIPIETIFNRFPRVVRDLSQAQGKQVRLELEGSEVRIDKGMVEALLDPLMHMVRNSVDHGIEMPDERAEAGKSPTARVLLRAVQRGNQVAIEISDDGRGLGAERIRKKAVEKGLCTEAEVQRMPDADIYRMIFAAGFSTKEQVTETSGRGVGMDVVHTNVTKLGGTIEVQSVEGQGSTFILMLPLSAAIQNALIVEVEGQMMAIPDRYLAEIYEVGDSEYQSVRGQKATLLRNNFLPLFYLGDLLGKYSTKNQKNRPIVVLVSGRQRIGLEVDRLFRRQELFVKDIHPKLAAIPGVGGASIMGDGRVILILDGDDLFRLAERSGTTGYTAQLDYQAG